MDGKLLDIKDSACDIKVLHFASPLKLLCGMYCPLYYIILHFLAEFCEVSAVSSNANYQRFILVRVYLRTFQCIRAYHIELNMVDVEVYESPDNLYDPGKTSISFNADRIKSHVEQST